MKLFKKFFFTTSVIILVSLTVMMSILSFFISNFFSREKYVLLKDNCEAVSHFVAADINSSNYRRNLYNIINIQNETSDVDIFVCDNKGRITVCGCSNYHTEMDCAHSSVLISPATLKSVGSEDYFRIGNVGDIYKEEQYTLATAVRTSDNKIQGYVFVSTSTKSLRNLMRRIFSIYLISAIFPIAIMFIATFAISYNLVKPLKMMSDAARSMAEGDFTKRVPVLNDDEIGELSVSFNNMTDSLAKLEGMRRSFIGNVSHELRTPMTTIAGFIDGIIDGTIPKEKHNEYLSIISEEVNRLSRIVESMLNISRLESGAVTLKKTRFDLAQLVINVVISRESVIDQHNFQILGLDSLEKAEIFADYDLIYQVIYNLVDNAVKFTDENGKISFAIYSNNNFVELAIKNSGEGIPKDQLEFIFDRFYKIDKSRSNVKNSSGLGLFIVKTIVELHGGKISVESEPDEFTLLRVVFPNESNERKD